MLQKIYANIIKVTQLILETIMLFKKLRCITDDYSYDHTPEQIWPFIINPLALQTFESESCYEIESLSDTLGVVGSKWTERHIAEVCAGDVFEWTVTINDAPNVYQITSLQHGLQQTATYTLILNEFGYTLRQELTFTPIFSKRIKSMLGLWAMLATGLLVKFADDKEETMAWFQNLETALNETDNS